MAMEARTKRTGQRDGLERSLHNQLVKQDGRGRSILHLAASSGSKETFIEVLNACNQKRIEGEQDEPAPERGNNRTASTFSSAGEIARDPDDPEVGDDKMKDMLTMEDTATGSTVLMAAASSGSKSIFHAAVHATEQALDFQQEKASIEQELKKRDTQGRSLLHLAAASGKKRAVGAVWDACRWRQSKEELWEMLTSKDKDTNVSTLMAAAEIGAAEAFKAVLAFMRTALGVDMRTGIHKDDPNVEKLKQELLLPPNSDRGNILGVAVTSRHTIEELAKKEYEDQALRERVVTRRHKSTVDAVWNACKGLGMKAKQLTEGNITTELLKMGGEHPKLRALGGTFGATAVDAVWDIRDKLSLKAIELNEDVLKRELETGDKQRQHEVMSGLKAALDAVWKVRTELGLQVDASGDFYDDGWTAMTAARKAKQNDISDKEAVEDIYESWNDLPYIVENGLFPPSKLGSWLTRGCEEGGVTVASVKIFPAADFIFQGVFTLPTEYHRVPVMRMALDFVVYLGMVAALSYLVLFHSTGGTPRDDGMVDRNFRSAERNCALIFITSGVYRERREMHRNIGMYLKDKWNVLDALGLLFVFIGLVIRWDDSSSPWGPAFYSLSAPLVVSRILFFAQILPYQGPMIQVIFRMTSKILQFGAVMAVVMIGFAMALHVLFRDLDSFGQTFLGLFKAMLGDTELFKDFSGGRYDGVASFLVIVYLFIVTIMLLNLLIAILSTAHAQWAIGTYQMVTGICKLSKTSGAGKEELIVESILRKDPRAVGADRLREFLENPMNDYDVRQDEKEKKPTVEHVKLLRDRLESRMAFKSDVMDLRNDVEDLRNEVKKIYLAVERGTPAARVPGPGSVWYR
eukprot:g5043.t1